jgi:hypothetical protein
MDRSRRLAPPGSLVDRTSHGGPWRGAHFLTYESTLPLGDGDDVTVDAVVRGESTADAILRSSNGEERRLSDELDGADVAVMIATHNDGADGARIIGAICARRGIMTAGLVVPNDVDGNVARTVSMLRPYAMVLLVSRDADDLPEVLTALRA